MQRTFYEALLGAIFSGALIVALPLESATVVPQTCEPKGQGLLSSYVSLSIELAGFPQYAGTQYSIGESYASLLINKNQAIRRSQMSTL
jgi:hypothetical protein